MDISNIKTLIKTVTDLIGKGHVAYQSTRVVGLNTSMVLSCHSSLFLSNVGPLKLRFSKETEEGQR